jgi:hypothetical protein
MTEARSVGGGDDLQRASVELALGEGNGRA